MGLMRRTALLVLVGALCAIAACGGDDGEQSAVDRPAAASPASAAPSSDCSQLVELRSTVEAAFSGQAGDVMEPKEFLERYSESAPKEIQADIRVIADAYGKIAGALRAAEPEPSATADPAALERLAATVSGLDQDAVATANAHVTSWVTAHC